uniref:NADH-ubiquinone oxidoreductase chain 6 n=1 Tax=Thraustotheca clavata TaxID=74557 RepID=S5UFJ3_9STRA|nr:NADH dehydrogenase subunit 6 [Thraustotheca clavata]AGS55518.1 NADH dehydrogenase subunit 6 [Thraustotheca clavata]
MFFINHEVFFFFLFSSIALTSAIFVIYSKNSVYSVFFLILVFTNMTGLLLVAEVEFLAIMLIIIYVGAITVLFLFVVMMLDIKKIETKNNRYGYLPIILLISFIFFIEIFIIFSKSFTSYHYFIYKNLVMGTYSRLCEAWTLRYSPAYETFPYYYNQWFTRLDEITNIETLGQILYTYNAFFLLVAGLILLIALIGAVMLTIKEKKNKKFLTKNLYKQLSRNYLNAVYNIKQKKIQS